MRTILTALATMTFAAAVNAETPAESDAIQGAFDRMLTHEATPLPATHRDEVAAADRQIEHWVNAVARGESSSLELGFAHMLARADDVAPALVVRGEPDAVEVMVAAALQEQARASRVQRRAAL